MSENENIQINADVFRKKLETTMSPFNAKLIVESAFVSSGITNLSEGLDKNQAHTICLALIKKGGPASRVGTEVYKSYLQ